MSRPDTLDLREPAELCLRYFKNCVDPELGNLPYWGFTLDAPKIYHSYFDGAESIGSWVDAMILLRQITGNEDGLEVERAVKKIVLSVFGEDGLPYNPIYPWSPILIRPIHTLGYFLNGLVTWYLESEDKQVEKAIKGTIKRLLSLVSRVEERLPPFPYGLGNPTKESSQGILTEAEKRARAFPEKSYYFPFDARTSTEWRNFERAPPPYGAARDGGILILALARFYEATEDEDASDLAEGLSNYCVYDDDVEYMGDGRFIGHFHCLVWTAAGILKFGIVKERKEYVEWAKRVYDFARSLCSNFGWVPETAGLRNPINERCETCCIADMVQTATLLAKAGYTEYWEDVERFVRNHLLESQLVESHVQKSKTVKKKNVDKGLGSFNGSILPNDIGSLRVWGCCGHFGARALFIAWDSIIEKRKEGVFVNLALNRDSQWAEVVSYYPYEGKLKVIVHDAPTLFTRVPLWARRVTVHVDDQPRPLEWVDDYVKLCGLKKGQEVTITHSMEKKEEIEVVGGREYKVYWRGYTVVKISPPGQKYPLYERSHMDSNEAPIVEKRETPLPTKEIHW